MPTTLPPEIIYGVITHLRDGRRRQSYGHDAGTRVTLQNLCLASSMTRYAATPMLYESIIVSRSQLGLLAASLNKSSHRPHPGRAIRRISFRDFDSHKATPNVAKEHVLAILRQTPFLECLIMDGPPSNRLSDDVDSEAEIYVAIEDLHKLEEHVSITIPMHIRSRTPHRYIRRLGLHNIALCESFVTQIACLSELTHLALSRPFNLHGYMIWEQLLSDLLILPHKGLGKLKKVILVGWSGFAGWNHFPKPEAMIDAAQKVKKVADNAAQLILLQPRLAEGERDPDRAIQLWTRQQAEDGHLWDVTEHDLGRSLIA